VRGFDHGDVVRPIPDRQGDFIEVLSDHLHYLCLLDGQQPAANHCLAGLGQVCQFSLAVIIDEDVG